MCGSTVLNIRVLVLGMVLLSPIASTDTSAQIADDFLVVDCLLPGQIRQLGQRTVYVSARRPVKTSATDCQIRGGEYVAYDRADYATALRVWAPRAEAGDAEASVNVGEIYEKGLGIPPDYEAAARWYRSAADAGNTRAQINLGHLYELGLGVERDPLAALEWYRRASGLEETIQLDPGQLSAEPPPEIETLRAKVDELRAEEAALQEAVGTARTELGLLQDAEQRISIEQRQRREQQQQEALANATAEASLNESLANLSRQVEARTLEAAELEQQIEEMRGELATTGAELAASRAELEQNLAELERANAALADAEEVGDAQRQELETLAANVAEKQSTLTERESLLAERQDTLNRLQSKVSALEAEASHRREEIGELQSQQTSLQQQALAGPEIVLIDPALQTTRGVAVVAAVAIATSSRQIVGQVTAPAGLLSLTLNGQRVDTDALGLFTTEITRGRAETPVSIVAVDRQGKRADLDFVLQPSEAAANAPEPADAVTVVADRPDIDFGNYFALLIGNDDYHDLPQLRTAVRDATEVASVLESAYGFETRVLTNATRYEILSALNDYREQLTSDDNLLIYYAGHGELDEANARGYWLPIDAEPTSNANWISNVAITDILNAMAAKQVLVVADSCYSGSLTRSSVGTLAAGMTEAERLHWLESMSQKRARMVLTSGGLSPVLDSGGGEHSVFARAFLEVLTSNRNLTEGHQIYRDVSARVAFAAANAAFDQVPEYAPIRYAGHESGDFFFVPTL